MSTARAPEAWSPLRPKILSSVLAAAADDALPRREPHQTSDADGGSGAQVVSQEAAAHAAPLFELPENVSRRPAAARRAAAEAPPALGAQGAVHGWKRRRLGITGDAGALAGPAGTAPQPQRKKPRMRPLTGPEKAAVRKRRQQLAKKAVSRRVALWRSRLLDGEQQVVYVTLGGEVLQKGGRAFRAATADQKYLKANGIVSFKPTKSSIDVPEDLRPYSARRGEDPLELAYWCIPESVEACYRDAGVRRLHRWQADCLKSPEVLQGRSLVYVAPTSAGKSLVSEVIMLRQLLFRGRRALLVLPYVSICAEKVMQLRRTWGACGLRVEALYSAGDGKWHAGADVAVCTIEKASALLNRLLEEDSLLRDIGVVVVDEMHLLGEEHRGYLLELIMVKARLSAQLAAPAAAATGGAGSGLQIVGLSATLPNVGLLAEWLGAHLYVCDERPVPLSLSVASKGQVLQGERGPPSFQAASAATLSRSRPRDPDGLTPLVWECVSAAQAVLIFCATKEWCEKAAVMLADELSEEEKQLQENSGAVNGTTQVSSKLDKRLQLLEELRQAPAGLCPVLAKTVPNGIAYHHAGLTVEERNLLEEAYRSGTINCLCATSTLAAGVNLPARRVIIRSMKVGSESLDAVRFRQMAGRAGRVGLDIKGECVVVAKSSRDADEAQALFTAQLQPLRSSLNGQRLVRAVLEVISLGLVRTVADLEGRFARSLLRFHEERESQPRNGNLLLCDWTSAMATPPGLLDDIRAALSYLEARQLVRVDGAQGSASPRNACGQSSPGPEGASPVTPAVHPPEATLLATPLGDGVVHSALRPAEALSVFEDLQRSRKGLCLDTDLHLIFLATPAATRELEPDWSRFLGFYERLRPRDKAVADAIGVSHDFLVKQSMGLRGPIQSGASSGDWREDRERITALHRRFWVALALRELVGEAPPPRVASAFGVPRGALQALQGLAATYCGMVRQLCERVRWHEMAAVFDCLMPRLNFGVSPEVLPLCRIAGVYPARARALLEAGLSSVEEVAKAPVSAVETALRKMSQFESRCTDSVASHHQEAVVRQAAQKIVRGAQERLGEELQSLEDEAEEARMRMRRTAGTGGQAAGQPSS